MLKIKPNADGFKILWPHMSHLGTIYSNFMIMNVPKCYKIDRICTAFENDLWNMYFIYFFLSTRHPSMLPQEYMNTVEEMHFLPTSPAGLACCALDDSYSLLYAKMHVPRWQKINYCLFQFRWLLCMLRGGGPILTSIVVVLQCRQHARVYFRG